MSLKEIRKKIDLLDSGILRALNDRMELALMAKKFKSSIEDSVREKELLDRIRRNSTGLINAEFVEKVYIEIINESKAIQKKDHNLIAFCGEHGAYGEVASREWNSDWVPIPCNEFASVFEGVKSGIYDYGIVPVENTLGGVVGEVNEILVSTNLYIVGAVELPVHLCLLVLQGTDHRKIHTVYSNSQVLAQCHNFLVRNRLQPVQYYDSAGAAKMLAEKTPKSSAVIGSKLAAEIYDLEIIKDDIDDCEKNMTRFLVLSKEESKEEGDKCSILFSIEHRAGALFNVLEVFARDNINLTRIGSIRSTSGSYDFFLDFLGSSRDENIQRVLKSVEKITTDFRFMGCYKERIL